MDKKYYSIKEVSNKLNLTEHTIRFYCDKKLVPTLERDKNNNRLFSEESVNWLIGVKYLKECGMSIDSIKKYIDLCLEGDKTIQERHFIIENQYEYSKVKLEEAKERVQFLENKLSYYNKIIEHKLNDNTNPKKW